MPQDPTMSASNVVEPDARFGRWLVIEESPRWKSHRGIYWLCRCDCGNVRRVSASALRRGRSKCCGCNKSEVSRRNGAMTRRHGMSGTYIHCAWSNMRRRCADPGNPAYKNYGGRGIYVCERWAKSFEAFMEDMGPRPSTMHTIDRIDNDGPYSPENCRWTDRLAQNLNKRTTPWVTIDGVTRTRWQWLEMKGLPLATYASRIKKGMSPEEAIMTPVQVKNSHRGYLGAYI